MRPDLGEEIHQQRLKGRSDKAVQDLSSAGTLLRERLLQEQRVSSDFRSAVATHRDAVQQINGPIQGLCRWTEGLEATAVVVTPIEFSNLLSPGVKPGWDEPSLLFPLSLQTVAHPAQGRKGPNRALRDLICFYRLFNLARASTPKNP